MFCILNTTTPETKKLTDGYDIECLTQQEYDLGCELPAGLLKIAENGCGDFLFLLPLDESHYDPAVWHWDHESQRMTKVADNIADLPVSR